MIRAKDDMALRDISALAGVNFFSTLNPVLWCSLTAWEFERCFPGIFNRQAEYVLVTAAVFVLPMICCAGISSYMMSKFPCRNILSCSKIIELFTALLMLAAPPLTASWGGLAMLAIMTLLLGFEYAMYRPALRCYMASMLARDQLSAAVGKVQCAAFFGAAAGIAICSRGADLGITGTAGSFLGLLLFIAFAAYGLVFATRVRAADALRPCARYALFRNLRRVRWQKQSNMRDLIIMHIGEIYVLALLICMVGLVSQYVQMHFNYSWLNGEYLLPILLLSALIGCGIGCLAGIKMSNGKVETGLIPIFGSLSVLLFAGMMFLPELDEGLAEYLLLLAGLFVFGLTIGIAMVPLQAYQEYFVNRELRPAFFASFYRSFGIGVAVVLTLTAVVYTFGIPILPAACVLAILTALLLIYAYWKMPHILLRCGTFILLHTLYRLRSYNIGNIPETAPALLVANRSSFVDMLLLTAVTSRPIRFLMHEKYFRNRWLYPWYKAAGFLEVPANKPQRLRRLFSKVQNALRNGELICVFPEEDITRNGVMSGFRDGMKEMIPPDLDVPVIPVRIGLTWGSIFSCYYGKFKLRWPQELPHPASVAAGAPVPPETSAYELRIILSELAAETENAQHQGERPFHSQFAALTKKHPRSVMIRELNDQKIVSKSNMKLLGRIILISRYLRRHRRDESEYIGVMLPNSINMFQAFTAILMADRIPAVLNYTSSAEAREYAIAKAGLRTIITSRKLLEKNRIAPAPGMIYIEDLIRKSTAPFRRACWEFLITILPTSELMKLVSPGSWDDVHRTAVVLFSSGSTGIPKGVMLTHHNIFCDVMSVIRSIGWTVRDRVPGNLPLFHSFGMAVCLWMPLYSGAEVIMLPNPLDASGVGKVMRERKATVLFATPSFLQLYMRRCTEKDFKSLRLVIAGAEQLRNDIADKFREMTGLMIAEAYGCTELSPVVSINLANSLMELGVEVARRGSIGPPLPGICVKIVDPSTFELLPEDTDGLLIVKGAVVMKGYLGEPGKTSEVIRDNWYVTGDIARMDRNGFITITGRLSRFSKIAGEMVPHELVEREINNIVLPDTRVIAVTGCADKERGEKLVVFYSDPELIAPEQITRALREKQIPNLWIPRTENFIRIDELPMLGSGKLDLGKLNALAAELES